MATNLQSSPFDLEAVDRNAVTRFRALSELFDFGTRHFLRARGLRRGWRCLEVGAGGGSIAQWLGKRVGSMGRVIATDVNTRLLENRRMPNVEIWRHDITCDPLPDAAFDLVHTRMTLIHIPERDNVLNRLVATLKPGGWLVAEEFDGLSLCADPVNSPGEHALKTHQAMQWLSQIRGADPRYGRLLLGRLRALGLADTAAEGRILMVQQGSAAATLLRASYELRRTAMIAAGYLTDSEFEEDIEALDHLHFMMPSPILWTAWGQKTACA